MHKPFALALALALAAVAALLPGGAALAATYAIDPAHTRVTWEQLHFGTSTNRGTWARHSGTVIFDRAARSGQVKFTLDMKSVSTHVPPFDRHLKSAEFFDVARFPAATFNGDRFVFEGDRVREVQGSLTLRGKTHPVTLKALRFNCYDNPMLNREVCGGDFEAVIRRSLWGVNWGLDMGVPDDTRLTIQIEAVKQ